ncbi:MAG: glucose-6-phosphate dehydrogenase [Bacteroidales bacterium]|nr:glucose-6-phosphate dehydrogenase [Bacteroidales bacterium]MDD2425498.1 glucose-6-phosphate dehydrogenase [Bacteroidales bacterium]MDD3989778.1 glucose-6-phosphate dehydrogenase [Bacteroidales bacterium]
MKKPVFVIFGASGDLARRKLLPALFRLFKNGSFPAGTLVLGAGRSSFTTVSYREMLVNQSLLTGSSSVKERADAEKFLENVEYLVMDPSKKEDYTLLKERLITMNPGSDNYIFYMATPPSLSEIIPHNLSFAGLNRSEKGERCARRVVVEKPFGYNLASATKINNDLLSLFGEEQIYRIDHYLGKETVQNILALRFSNTFFEPLWNRNYIDRVEITAVENFGIGERGEFYERTGALRDMVQNHLIQLLALVAMEPPLSFNEKEFRDEVVKVLRALRPLNQQDIPSSVVRGQYIQTEGIKGYRQEKNVAPDSHTETFMAMKIFVDNWRWQGIPFYIRTGKQMPTKVSEIVIHFRPTPHKLFSGRGTKPEQNQLVIRIQPNEGLLLRIDMKIPGRGFEVGKAEMEFTYDKLGEYTSDDPYARLLLDCISGDNTLFTRSDAVEASWNYFEPLLNYLRDNPDFPLYGYPAGTWGPPESNSIIEVAKGWTNPCKNLTNTDLYCEL